MMKLKIFFIGFLFYLVSLFGQNFRPGIVKESFNFKEVANFQCTPVSYTQSVFSHFVSFDSTKIKYNFNCQIIEKKDSFTFRAELLQFKSMMSAFEYFCQFLLPDSKSSHIAWETCYLDDSTAVSWYDEMVFLSHFKRGEKPEKHLRKIFRSTKKLKSPPNFLSVFPDKQKVKNSIRFSSRGWMQQKNLKHVFYSEYEVNGNVSRILLMPVKRDSIYIIFQEFVNFLNENHLLVQEKLPTDLPNFVAQDMFLGRLGAVLYKNYIIGFMNYPSPDWVKDRIKELIKNLKSHPIHLNQLK